MRGTIFKNTFLLSFLTLLISGILFCGILYQEYERQAFEGLSAEALLLAETMEHTGISQSWSVAQVTHFSPNGTVLYDSVSVDSWNSDWRETHPEISQAFTNGVGQHAHHTGTYNQRMLHYALRLSDGSLLHLSRTHPSLSGILMEMLWPLTLVLVTLLILAAIISFRLARKITRNINSISPDNPQPVYPELFPLVDRLQQQNTIIRQQMDQLRQQMREFKAITENMGEGLLLLDVKGNVLSENAGFQQLLDCGEISHLRNFEIPVLIEAAEQALVGRRSEQLLPQADRILQVIANPVLASGQVVGAVILTMDVTEQQQREDLRREFSANVSHELKTPLTAISGFAELIREGLVPQEKIPEFADDIHRESRRLMDLVEDILNLSRLDEGNIQFEMTPVDIQEICQQVVESLQPVADRTQVQLMLTGTKQILPGVPRVLYEMVYNLCDNAIKYNRPGGSVHIRLEQREGHTVLEVSDTGIGIPYAHQSRIFERFYRVDKSHSRSIGGTGLGLSIVKHSAQLHNAQLHLESQPEQGTTITVIF